MNKDEVEQLKDEEQRLHQYQKSTLLETHISWVILTDHDAYKIKKPVKFSFLDFSNLEKRKYYCEQELILNRRLATQMYLQVVPICKNGESFSFNGKEGEVIDYAVLMKRMDAAREMDQLLKQNSVDKSVIKSLAAKIAAFHAQATVVRKAASIDAQKSLFNDLATLQDFIEVYLDKDYKAVVQNAMEKSNRFLKDYEPFIAERSENGFVRDLHGDLHTGNIFLYKDPVIFDCIEFNDEMRQVDVLDEMAFLCMDLESYGRPDLSDYLFRNYLGYEGTEMTEEERLLFGYYKVYRANIRAKVHLLHARERTDNQASLEHSLKMAAQYLDCLKRYLTG